MLSKAVVYKDKSITISQVKSPTQTSLGQPGVSYTLIFINKTNKKLYIYSKIKANKFKHEMKPKDLEPNKQHLETLTLSANDLTNCSQAYLSCQAAGTQITLPLPVLKLTASRTVPYPPTEFWNKYNRAEQSGLFTCLRLPEKTLDAEVCPSSKEFKYFFKQAIEIGHNEFGVVFKLDGIHGHFLVRLVFFDGRSGVGKVKGKILFPNGRRDYGERLLKDLFILITDHLK